MGGNLFKLGRLPCADYLRIEQELRTFLDQRYGPDLYRIPRFYRNKPDFGDADILLSKKVYEGSDWETVKAEIIEGLGIATHLQKTSKGFFQTVYRNFQVDFVLVKHAHLDSIANFMHYNDLGNLIGRLFRPFHLKYSGVGLSYVFRRENDNHYKKELFVSNDWKKILEFVGLDYHQWKEGFDTLEEMYEWLLVSPYFRVSSYSRMFEKKAKERTTIRNFLTYLEEHQIDRSYQARPEREAYVEEIEAHFGVDLKSEIENERRKEVQAKALNAKLNGNMVMGWLPECKGKILGRLLTNFRSDISPEQLLSMSSEEIEEEVRQRYTTLELELGS